MVSLLRRQELIAECIPKMETNIKKDAASRKPTYYIEKGMELLVVYINFQENHLQLLKFEDNTAEYFMSDAYGT